MTQSKHLPFVFQLVRPGQNAAQIGIPFSRLGKENKRRIPNADFSTEDRMKTCRLTGGLVTDGAVHTVAVGYCKSKNAFFRRGLSQVVGR
jgi:hypothetical protein